MSETRIVWVLRFKKPGRNYWEDWPGIDARTDEKEARKDAAQVISGFSSAWQFQFVQRRIVDEPYNL